MTGSPGPADRALSPVVGKTLELGVVVLLVALLSSTLFGGVVPAYRDAAGAEVGDRTLARTATTIERTVPPPADPGNATTVRGNDSRLSTVRRVPLPRTIRGSTYELTVENRSLVLHHPRAAVGGRTPLSLPVHVASVAGTWSSGTNTTLRVRANATGVHLRLEGST